VSNCVFMTLTNASSCAPTHYVYTPVPLPSIHMESYTKSILADSDHRYDHKNE